MVPVRVRFLMKLLALRYKVRVSVTRLGLALGYKARVT